MDETSAIAALRTIRTGLDDLIVSLGAGEGPDAGRSEREIDLMREFDRPPGQGLTQQEASRACKRHGFNPQIVGAWVRGGWIRVDDGRRCLTEGGREWLSQQTNDAA